ncbi:MAG: arginase family protein [Thermoproteota archaeon]|nr:arginase family protein [Thermoproteota archaeon]
MDTLSLLEKFFIKPENTDAGINFCDIPTPISFLDSNVSIIGIPIDITTTFGKTASYGPQAIRLASSKQIETLVFEKNIEIFEKSMIFDFGDLALASRKNNVIKTKTEISGFWKEFDVEIAKITNALLDSGKKPLYLGGEHTITYSIFKAFSKYSPLLVHFDAHRDLKPIYDGMEMCHTTPFYHLINEGILNGSDLVQIGIRQADKEENTFASKSNVKTFSAWDCHYSFEKVKGWLREQSKNRNVYISFDIDVYDIPYVPCSGTPEPFGLDPFQVNEIINSFDSSSCLLGLDIVEAGLKNHDYREGALATQTLLRILTHDFVAGNQP